MTREELADLFAQDEAFGTFADVAGQRSPYRDLHAMLLLAELQPRERPFRMLSDAGYGKVWFCTNFGELAKIITKEQVVELRRCGVWYDCDRGSLAMFV